MRERLKGGQEPKKIYITNKRTGKTEMHHALPGEKATQAQWDMVDMAIKAFITKYPLEWQEFTGDLQKNRTKYQEALPEHVELKKAQWRNVLSFPVIQRWDEDLRQYVEKDSLLPILRQIIPDITAKKGKNFLPFIKKYPEFIPGEKI